MDFDVVPYEDIIWGERIGGGSFGSVFKGQYLGIDIAIKEIHMSNQYDVQKYFEREWRIMRECRHPNIVLFLGLSKEMEGDGRVFIVSEFIPRGNLRSFIRSPTPFPWLLRISFATDVARAVAYLHARQCLHRDLKGENLLITSNDRLKVADFGFARITGRNAEEMKHMTYCGTDGYMSPEIIMGEQFDLPTDVYSLGIIFIEILTRILVGSKVYSRKAPKFVPDGDVVRRRASPGCPPDFINLALECCQFSPAARPKMAEVLERLRMIEREIERGVAEDAPHTGSLRLKHKPAVQQGAAVNALKALFDVTDTASELAAAEVEEQLLDYEDDSFTSTMEVDSPPCEAKEVIAIARAEVPVNGAGPAKSIPWDEMNSEFTDHVGDITPPSGAEPLLGESVLSWRTASPDQTSTIFPDVAGYPLPQPSDPTMVSPARPMPCAYPPSPPYDEDEVVGSTCTIRGSHSSRAMTPDEEPPTPTAAAHGAAHGEVVLLWSEEEVGSKVPTEKPIPATIPAGAIPTATGLPTPQPSESGVSPKSSMQSSKVTHRFSMTRRQPPEAAAGRRPALLNVAANLAFAFLPRPAIKDKCSVCTKGMGSRVAMQCDDCGILVHTKCSATAPRNCHSEESKAAAGSLGVDP